MALRLSLFLNILLYTTLKVHTITTVAEPTYLDSRCSDNMNFAPNSTYQTDLNSVFLSLTSKAVTATAGNNITNNTVYGLFLCREDLTTRSCKDCVEAATVGLSQSYCPSKKVGVIWYEECMVRYSNQSFFGNMAESPKVIIWNSRNITRDQPRFTEILHNVIADLVVHAGSNVSTNTFHWKIEKVTGFQTVKAFSQCTPDLTGSDCLRCLRIAVALLPVTSITGMVLQPSCNVGYEVYESKASLPSTSKIRKQSVHVKLSTEVIVATIVPVASVFVAVLTLCVIFAKRNKTALKDVNEDSTLIESLQYDLPTLQHATDNFSEYNKLGVGSSGTVFKGILSDGEQIAVKRMWSEGYDVDVRFRNQVLSLAKLQHRNLVKLIGFCLDGEDERLLVFEYMPYNLSRILFDPRSEKKLDWRSRFHIITGIAKGLRYLHQDSWLRVGHRDVKARSILLDEYMNPKISNFSLAINFHGDCTEGSSGDIAGTLGYICPHYYKHRRFSAESDVYSYGVLILEIISGIENSIFRSSHHLGEANDDVYNVYLHAREKLRDYRVLGFLDEAIRDEYSSSMEEIERCIRLGWLCIQHSKHDRPTMETVVLMLECHSVNLPMPEQPAYMSHEESINTVVQESVNYASITVMEPR